VIINNENIDEASEQFNKDIIELAEKYMLSSIVACAVSRDSEGSFVFTTFEGSLTECIGLCDRFKYDALSGSLGDEER